MLRGFATVSYFADDMAAARKWYTELLGIEPYFERAAFEGRHVGPGEPGYDQANLGYMEFRVGDYQHELGIIDRRYSPHASASIPAGAVLFWHVNDLPATLQRLLAMGAVEHEPPTPRGAGFVTASVVDPFGNILGVMYNPHYLEILATTGRA
jgi:predicted enzyme related to lactoylglutathione lyase